MLNDEKVLRALARAYWQVAQDERNQERKRLHQAVNDLQMIRPVVLIDELPWHEMNIDDKLTLRCEDPYLRQIEWYLRTTLYRHEYFSVDRIVPEYIGVGKCIQSTGIGITIKEHTLSTDQRNHIVAHEYSDQLATEADLARLKDPIITYDREETMKRYHKLGEIIGDIVPIRLKGIEYFGNTMWDDIAMYRGVTPLLMDLIERPEFMHQITERLTQIKLSEMDQYEALGLLDEDPQSLHCTPILTKDLPQKEAIHQEKRTRKDVWGRGTAQIFASVSKQMHEEFDIEYMKRTIGQCGLVYYGCCEPLDKKIDIVEKIPNLRKISITPWADVEVAAEAINNRYVLASKPNPASVAVSRLDYEALIKEIDKILSACKRYGCHCDIVLKDISTCGNRPENIFEWAKIVMERVNHFY